MSSNSCNLDNAGHYLLCCIIVYYNVCEYALALFIITLAFSKINMYVLNYYDYRIRCKTKLEEGCIRLLFN